MKHQTITSHAAMAFSITSIIHIMLFHLAFHQPQLIYLVTLAGRCRGARGVNGEWEVSGTTDEMSSIGGEQEKRYL